MRTPEWLSSLLGHVEGLVHVSAAGDPVTRAAHAGFIVTRLTAAAVALAAAPLYLALRGLPDLATVLIFALLVAPVGIAFDLSRTGRLERAHSATAVMFAALIGIVALRTGGLTSPCLAWFALIPLEAALSGRRSIVAAAVTIAMAALTGVGALDAAGFAGAALAGMSALAVIVGALAYAGMAASLLQGENRRVLEHASHSDELYRLIAENMGEVLAIHERDGRASFLSPTASRLFGAPVQDMMGVRFFDQVHVADRKRLRAAMAAAGGEPAMIEFRTQRHPAGGEGPMTWVEARLRSMHEEPDGQGRVLAVLRDVSERKAHELAVSKAQEEAERASLAKSRFLASVSHELRTPLNAIIGFSELLGQESFGPLGSPRNREYVGLIHQSGEHLLQVVNGILDMSKIETGRFAVFPEPVAIRPLIESCCAIMSAVAERGRVSVEMLVRGDLPEVVADKRACKQMLLNLLSNGIKFTKPGGHVRVSARVEGGELALSVADSGIGIAAQDLPRIGEPFFQGDSGYARQHEGTGLGLSVVNGLVELHGGRMEIESEVDHGTVVKIRLPIRRDCAAEPLPLQPVRRTA